MSCRTPAVQPSSNASTKASDRYPHRDFWPDRFTCGAASRRSRFLPQRKTGSEIVPRLHCIGRSNHEDSCSVASFRPDTVDGLNLVTSACADVTSAGKPAKLYMGDMLIENFSRRGPAKRSPAEIGRMRPRELDRNSLACTVCGEVWSCARIRL